MKFTQNQWFYCDILKFQTSKGKKRNQICKSIAYSVYFPTHKCSGSDIFQQKKKIFLHAIALRSFFVCFHIIISTCKITYKHRKLYLSAIWLVNGTKIGKKTVEAFILLVVIGGNVTYQIITCALLVFDACERKESRKYEIIKVYLNKCSGSGRLWNSLNHTLNYF